MRRLALSAVVASLLAACGEPDVAATPRAADAGRGAAPAAAGEPCADPLAEVQIAPEDRAVTTHAQNFAIDYDGPYKRITVRNPWRGADFELTHVLVPCGEPPPATSGARAIVIPAARVATTSTTQLPHLVALGIVDRLAGHNRLDFATEAEIRRRIDAGLVAEIGDSVRLDRESLLALRPDLVLATSIGNPELDVFAMLDRSRLPYVVDAAWTEATPLGRAEWLKFTAAFFNREAEANRLFAEIAARYEELAALVRSVAKRPTVLVGTPFQGTWHVSGGAAYQARLIADAGGAYLWADDPTTGAIPLDFETVYSRGLSAEVWIHPYGWSSLADGLRTDARMADFASFRAGRVFNNDLRTNASGGNDYWETGSLRPDLILADLIEIFHPDLLDHELVFHRRLPPARGKPPG
ncbi:MAG TPA: ABC transporter substrate-binding protein [Thermoanaerobaculia bacterium]|nr:ABC transporter substrate-binding protein [Thermoanaerobaculia bacterium]